MLPEPPCPPPPQCHLLVQKRCFLTEWPPADLSCSCAWPAGRGGEAWSLFHFSLMMLLPPRIAHELCSHRDQASDVEGRWREAGSSSRDSPGKQHPAKHSTLRRGISFPWGKVSQEIPEKVAPCTILPLLQHSVLSFPGARHELS